MTKLPVSVRGRFKRSVDLVRDFYAAPNIDGYIVTPAAQSVLDQVEKALSEDRPTRAWTLTGPYGGGKSAFALFASHVMRGTSGAIEHLNESNPGLAERYSAMIDRPFCPILVSGSRQSLSESLLQGLADSLSRFVSDTPVIGDTEQITVVAKKAEDAVGTAVTDEEIVELFADAAEAVNELTGAGVFVVVDELGKMLEYAAVHPEDGDIFALQLLAERASRTAGSDQPPLLLTTILHQAFDQYASHLDQVQRQEWQKVQGRFEDIAFVESSDTTLKILAEAIDVEEDAPLSEHHETVERVITAADLPNRFDEKETGQLLKGALPLHPAVALIVGRLFRRLAQNERSLFAFLAAGEPGGFIDVVRSGFEEAEDETLPLYRLDHLYDYLLTTLGGTLFNQSTSRLWAETESARGRLKDDTPLSDQLLKQIALLNFAGDMSGLSASTDMLLATSDAGDDLVRDRLQALVNERVVVYRKYDDSYRIWEGSDLDLDRELEEARSNVSPDVPLASLLREIMPPSPIAAYRHSYDTGTTRVFDVLYASGGTWKQDMEQLNNAADGHVVYVLPEREDRREELLEELEDAASDEMLFFAVPDGAGSLRKAVYELKCLDWISENNEDLEGDRAARRELRERRADLSNRVESRLNRLLVSDAEGKNPCEWIRLGERFRIANNRELQRRLSTACDTVFHETPEISNELLNLRQPSPSAVRGQKKLLEAMVLGNDDEGRVPDKKRLGIDGTPAEYGLYASIVRATGMHREGDNGAWFFTHPYEDEKPGCYATWEKIDDTFTEANGKPVSIDTFFEVLTERPNGVREGLIPVFLFAYFKANQNEIALYENGTFLQQVAFGTLERLLKNPEKFDMQRVRIEGVREDVLKKLAPLVGLPEDERKPLPFVLRILRQVHGLPPFVRKTSRMSDEALAVREVVYRATDPTRLLFEELPDRLDIGIDSFLEADAVEETHVDLFVSKLQKTLREITNAYDALIKDVQKDVASAFDVTAKIVKEERSEIAERAQALEPHVSDDDLKALVIRATNEMMDVQAWYESIAALFAGKPPVKWLDEDVKRFRTELRRVAKKFRNREPLVFENGQKNGYADTEDERPATRLQRIRLGITTLGEPEEETVVQVHPEDEEVVDNLVERFLEALESDPDLTDKSTQVKLAALGKLIRRLSAEHELSLDTQLSTTESNE